MLYLGGHNDPMIVPLELVEFFDNAIFNMNYEYSTDYAGACRVF